MNQQPHQKTQRELGHQGVDVECDQCVQHGGHEKELRHAEAGRQQACTHAGSDHHEQGIEDVVAGNDA